MKNTINSLKHIGLSELESNIYITLLKETKSTGYKIAKLLGKPVSNVYKALSLLSTKGLVLIDESVTPKECIPVPIKEYFNSLESTLKENRKSLEEDLKQFENIQPREGIFQIDSMNQLIEKARDIINNAKSTIMIDSSPQILQIFKDIIEKRASQGINVLIKNYDSRLLKNCDCVTSVSTDKELEWKTSWCDIITDEGEFLLGVFNKENSDILQAVWSKSRYISTVLLSGFLHEFVHTKLTNTIYTMDSAQDILNELKSLHKKYFYSLSFFNELNIQLIKNISHK